MSQPVSYKTFCERYALDSCANDSREQFNDYCNNLSMFNEIVANEITQDAINKAESTK
jgi:Cdc6-like AAA superfamily ATPase